MLLAAAADLPSAADEDGYTPLHLAVISGNRALVKLLLRRGADVSAQDHERHTAIHWATGEEKQSTGPQVRNTAILGTGEEKQSTGPQVRHTAIHWVTREP